MSGQRPRPAVPAPPPVAPPPFARRTLANGMRLLAAPRPRGVPLVDALFVMRGGAALDLPAVAGRATLTGALLEEGTATRSATDIADDLEQLGARLSVSTGWDAWTIALHTLEPALDEALAVVADVIAHATLPADGFARKRAEQHAEWLQDRSEPAVLAHECLQRSIFGPAHPYAAPLYGSDSTLAALQRADAADLRAAAMTPAQTFIAVAGAFDVDDLATRLERRIGQWRAGSAASPQPAPAAPAGGASATAGGPMIRIVPRPGASQSEVRVGCAGPPRSTPDYFPLLVMNTVLGGAFSSRLNRTLREEKGYTYGARSAFAFRARGGPFAVSVAVLTDATADTVAIIHREIGRMCTEPVDGAELDRARRFLARGLPRLVETGELHALQLARMELHGLDDGFLADYVARVLAVDAEAVLAAAQRHLTASALHVAIAGDAARIEHGLADLAIAPVLVES
jgi:zinc protease